MAAAQAAVYLAPAVQLFECGQELPKSIGKFFFLKSHLPHSFPHPESIGQLPLQITHRVLQQQSHPIHRLRIGIYLNFEQPLWWLISPSQAVQEFATVVSKKQLLIDKFTVGDSVLHQNSVWVELDDAVIF